MSRPQEPPSNPSIQSEISQLLRPTRDHALATAREALLTVRSLLDLAVTSLERMAQPSPPSSRRSEPADGPAVNPQRPTAPGLAPNEDV